MTDLVVSTHNDGTLVVDSRLVAQVLGIEHRSFMDTIRKYRSQAEQAFGGLRFQTAVPQSPTGNPPRFIYLTEEQASFFATLSRNTENVVQFKKILVERFYEAKRLLQNLGVTEKPTTTVYIRRLQNMADHDVPYDVWTTFREGAEVLLMLEQDFRVPVSQMDLCDGSIGSHWMKYRQEQGINNSVSNYTHRFRDHRPDVFPNAFEYSELPDFRRWLAEVYIPVHLPKYLVDKYGKRAVRQIYNEQDRLNDYILEITEEKRRSIKQEEKHQIFLAAREALENRLLSDSDRLP